MHIAQYKIDEMSCIQFQFYYGSLISRNQNNITRIKKNTKYTKYILLRIIQKCKCNIKI